MRSIDLHALLTDLHASIDRVIEEVRPDEPALAAAMALEAARLPRADELARPMSATRRTPSPRPMVAARRLRPLLYSALEEGLVDGRRFDALMLRRARAERLLERRARREGG
jgi:hypothetical protein